MNIYIRKVLLKCYKLIGENIIINRPNRMLFSRNEGIICKGLQIIYFTNINVVAVIK